MTTRKKITIAAIVLAGMMLIAGISLDQWRRYNARLKARVAPQSPSKPVKPLPAQSPVPSPEAQPQAKPFSGCPIAEYSFPGDLIGRACEIVPDGQYWVWQEDVLSWTQSRRSGSRPGNAGLRDYRAPQLAVFKRD